MKALIIDDEPPARRELRRLLSGFPWVEIIGECGNIVEAAAKVETLAPALLFLDIQMPGGSGFDLLTRLEQVPQVIFTTAHDEHAVRAFEVNALDYLLKPIDPVRLSAALSRVRVENAATVGGPRPDAPLQQLFLRDGSQCWFVPLREVSLLTSEGNYVRLSWGARQPLLGRPLSTLERRLDPDFSGPTAARSSISTSSKPLRTASTAACTCSFGTARKWRFPGARRVCSARS
jgi:two-component system, LytTR family, response regulator